MTSSSSTKSPYSFSVTKKVFGVLGTVIPVIVPLSITYSAFPVIFFHPLNVLPSNRFVQPLFIGLTVDRLVCANTTEQESRKIDVTVNKYFILMLLYIKIRGYKVKIGIK